MTFDTGGHEAPTEGLKKLFAEALGAGKAQPQPNPRVAVPQATTQTVPVDPRPRAVAGSDGKTHGRCKDGCEVPSFCVVPHDGGGQRMALVCPMCLVGRDYAPPPAPEPTKAGPQQQWDNYQRALCITYNVCLGNPVDELRRCERKVGDCGDWITRFIMTAGKDVVICKCCGKTAFYGIETLAQTGRMDDVLACIRAKIVRKAHDGSVEAR